jgi:peptide deformylase
MATRNILKDGERGLNKKSRTVKDFNNRLHVLLDDMRETLIDANGLGLAAPQVGVLRRVALIVDTTVDADELEMIDDELETASEAYEVDISNQIIELVNPEIISKCGTQSGSEGCLSVPGVFGIVTRPETVLVRAQDRNGDSFEIEVSNLAARAVCHEIDHLDGIIFTSIAERLLDEDELAELNAAKNEDIEDEDEKEEENSQT